MAPLMIALLLVLNFLVEDGNNDKQPLPPYANNNPAAFANINYPISSMDL